MKRWRCVTIIGAGLIGGSIGMAIRNRGLADQVVGVGRRAASLRVAKKRGAIDRSSTRIDLGVRDADLIVVCTPVESIAAHVLEAAAACPPDALITDAGSTKESIVREVERGLAERELADQGERHAVSSPKPVFIGSHPIA